MRLTIFLLIMGCLAVQASGYAQKVNLSVQNAGIESVCIAIKNQTGYFFLYDADVLKKSGNVSLELKNADLTEALSKMTSGKGLGYKIIDQTVIISKLKVSQEEIVIKGTVKSKESSGRADMPVPGVMVTIKGTKKATVTNGDGNYTIQAPANATLVFSMIGYGSREIAVNGNKTINVLIQETASELQEVIVTAYGTSEKKENQIGSAFQVTSEQLERRPAKRIDELLEGIVPGLQYEVQGGGTSSPRPRYQTRVRGEASFGASNEPLWVLDGIPINTGNETNMTLGVNTSISPLTYINPADIESVVVLKDATATSIYGADGSNGVILITTKKGKAGERKINYAFRTGINLINNNRFHVLNGNEYRELYAESYRNNTALNQAEMPDLGSNNTDWYDVFFRTGVNTQHDLSFSGGYKNTRYYVSGAYYNERPIMIKNRTQRFSSRINLDQKVNKSIDLFLRVGASYNINNMFSPGTNYYTNRPTDSPFRPDGTPILAFYNKLLEAEHNDNRQKANVLQGNAGGTINILPGFTFTSTNGIDYQSIKEDFYSSQFAYSDRGEGMAAFSKTRNFDWNSQQRLNFDKTFGKHDVSALLGAEARSQDRESNAIIGNGFENDDIRDANKATKIRYTTSGDEKTALSYYGQLRYTFDGRYSVLGSFRNDGNSDFGSDVKWAKFSSIGTAWTISNESFWKIRQVDFAKLKMSYGTNGNSRIGAYRSKGIYSTNADNATYNGELGAKMISGENPVLSWETTYIINGGLSLGLFKRISLEIEGYRNVTEGLLNDVDVSRTTGFTYILQNVGSVRNKGIELTLNTQNILKKDFTWNTRFNLARNTNRILKLYNNNTKVLDKVIRQVGEDVNVFYLVRWAGVDPADGGPLWYDTRGNLTKTFDLANRVTVGSSTPDFFGGMTNSFQYKQFTLSALMIYNVGGYAFSDLQRDSESDGRNLKDDNQSTNLLDRWREPGDLSNIPKTVLNENANNARNSTRFLHKKTSLRLQNVSVNYNFSEAFLKRISLSRANVYLQADNVGFWTPYTTSSNRNDYKNSFNPYPQPLVLSFGLNVSLK
ncbi:SusC/RagA family TonB-linked outer membrane protein [Pedobacter heparinus]|uniref:TonB-dependent receptor plug n=1 Tax=Pedobacter heparinus (strain ATCC 13125 / DSM 2366 / CIP 104194 / JCM 7457 / NBRC 12017 / NCIMB 9290 / NRRL B-14731 / HIM 762-3) TaxID=485917 RepID=C6XZX0_PEDHD|nr:SusC/RagA family TonB-linked outer membrane protein [Pedobacter heparinus]ACU02665.1 TonB-dependent receptor plug [Pedobacter heparinus DSM 2366]